MAVALSPLVLCAATALGADEPQAKPKENVVKALRRTTPMG